MQDNLEYLFIKHQIPVPEWLHTWARTIPATMYHVFNTAKERYGKPDLEIRVHQKKYITNILMNGTDESISLICRAQHDLDKELTSSNALELLKKLSDSLNLDSELSMESIRYFGFRLFTLEKQHALLQLCAKLVRFGKNGGVVEVQFGGPPNPEGFQVLVKSFEKFQQ